MTPMTYSTVPLKNTYESLQNVTQLSLDTSVKSIKNQWIDGLRRFEPDLESITPENQECIGYLINDGKPRRKTTHSANHSSHCLAKSFVQRKAHHLQMGH